MIAIDYLFLDYDFLEDIDKISNIECNTVEYETNLINFQHNLTTNLKKSESLIVLDFDKDNNLIPTFTTGQNEISKMTDILTSVKSKNDMHILITYLDKDEISRDGYLLKFNNNFIIYRNSSDTRMKNMSRIPNIKYLKETNMNMQLKNKNQFNFLIPFIKYSKETNNIYIQPSFKPFFENYFNINNIKVNYYNNKFKIEYIVNDNKRYNIIIIKEYNINNNYKYICIISEISNKISNTQNISEKTEDLLNICLNEIDENLYEAGLYDLIDNYKMQYKSQPLPDIVYQILFKDDNYKVIQKDITHNNFHNFLNTKFKINLDNINNILNCKQESTYTENLIHDLNKIKSFVINNSSNIINLKQNIDFQILDLFQSMDNNKYFITLNKNDKIYEFSIMKINSENFIAILIERNDIKKNNLIHISSIKLNEKK